MAVLLLGPTAVGKTEISVQVAERLGAEIVSVDSRLFYRGMDIGTAKPSAGQRARVPHHLIDLVEPNETVGLAEFQRRAQGAIRGIISRGKLPLLVGGTGQYVRAVQAGWSPPAVPPNEYLRTELTRLADERGSAWLHEGLGRLDAESAGRIDARNVRRTVRALEVILTTGKRFSELRGREPLSYRLINIGLRRTRKELYARIDARIDRMLEEGWLEESRQLLRRGYASDLPAFSAIGYPQCIKVIQGDLDLEQAKAEIRRATRALVRRQSNWFKESDPSIRWFDAGGADVVARIVAFIQERASREGAPALGGGTV